MPDPEIDLLYGNKNCDAKTFSKIFGTITKYDNDDYNKILFLCIKEYEIDNNDIINFIIKKDDFIINKYVLNDTRCVNNIFYKIINLYIEMNKILNFDFMNIFLIFDHDGYLDNKKILMKKIIECIDVNLYEVKLLLYKYSNLAVPYVMKYLNHITDDDLVKILMSIKIFKELVFSGEIQLNQEHLFFACCEHHDLVHFILEHKVIPTSKCLFALFDDDELNTDVYPINLEYNGSKIHKYYFDDYMSVFTGKKLHNLVLILFDYGLVPTLDDIKLLTRKHININFNDYGIVPDDELFNLYYKENFEPNYFENIKPSIDTFRKIFFGENKIPLIKKMIKNYGFQCDLICLQNACTVKNNALVIKFLLRNGIVPDIICIKNILTSNANTSVKQIFNKIIDKLKIEN
jgi:hypothetical protein